MLTVPLTKSDTNSAILGLNGLIFSGNTPADIQFVIFLLSNVTKLSIGAKTTKLW